MVSILRSGDMINVLRFSLTALRLNLIATAQVVGSKWVWMAPPSVSAYMQAFGSPVNQSSPTPACDPTREDADSVDENDNATTHLMTNTSQLDVTLTPSHRALQSNDSFVTQVEPVSMQAVLEAGDVLVMPPG